MRLTKYTHSLVRFDEGDRSLVIDPGVFSEAEAALAGADAVLITHEHADHLDADALRSAAAANPKLRVWAPSSVTAQVTDLGDRVTTVAAGDSFEAAGFAIEAIGGQHAVIHPSIPVVANLGYLVEGRVYHPGDSLIVPNRPVQTLLVPLSAPWSKMAEVIDFAVAVRAPQALPIHDVLLAPPGVQITEMQLSRIAGGYGVEYRHLSSGDALEV